MRSWYITEILVFQTPVPTTEGTECTHMSRLILALDREEAPMSGASSHLPYFQRNISSVTISMSAPEW